MALPKFNIKEKFISKKTYYYDGFPKASIPVTFLDVLTVFPLNLATNVDVDVEIQIQFNKDVKEATMITNNFYLEM